MDNLFAQVWKPLIVCTGTGSNPCTYEKLIELTQNLINNLIVLATIFATAAFMYAGFKLLTSGGNTAAKDEAKKIFWKVVWGFVWILSAWIVVYTITSVLLEPEFNTVLGQPNG